MANNLGMSTGTPQCDMRPQSYLPQASPSDLAAATRARVAAIAGDVIRLRDGGLWSAARPRTPLRIRCTAGTVWITQSGRPGDTLLHAGDTLMADGHGKLVIQALGDATVRVEEGSAR